MGKTPVSASRPVPKVGVAALASPLEVGAGRAPELAAETARRLSDAACAVVELGSVASPADAAAAGRRLAAEGADAAVLVPACWFEDFLVLDMLEEWPCPVLFRPRPGMETGALCGVQQATAFLTRLRRPFLSVYGEGNDEESEARSLLFLRAAELSSRMRRLRVGLAGARVPGMTHTSPAEFLLKRTMGPRIVPLDLARVEERAAAVPPGRAAALWRKTARRAACVEVSEAEGTAAAAFYHALRGTVGEQGLDALAVGCYPRLMGRVCLAASLLADEGIPLACEGDVHGAIAQYVLARLSGRPTHNADWLDPLPDGSVIFTHCGSGSFDLAAPDAAVRLAPVRLMGQGVCALFPAAAGPVTMLSLSAGTDRYELAMLAGEALPAEMVFPGNPLRVRFPAPVADVMAWIHREGIGHHWMAGYGKHATAVRDWVSMTGGGVRLLLPSDEPGAGR